MSTGGGAIGTVTGGSTGPVGTGTIACTTGSSAGCSAVVASGDSVTLHAAPETAPCSRGGAAAASGLGDCTLAMNGPKFLSASFQPATYTVQVSTSGGGVGMITGDANSLHDGATTGCTAVVDNTTPYQVLTLTATPDANSLFKGWTGCTTSSGNTCTVTVSSAKAVTAIIQPSTYPLNVTMSALYGASGTVSGPGISCTTGSTTGCSTSVANGATVTLVAEPAPGSFFKSWSGCTSVSGATCTVSMTGAKTATASFQLSEYALNVSV